MIKVMFSDGSQGMVKAARFVRLMKLGTIVAYRPFDAWIEVRRKGNDGVYFGPERRKPSLPSFKML
jgi:hypothetical protein